MLMWPARLSRIVTADTRPSGGNSGGELGSPRGRSSLSRNAADDFPIRCVERAFTWDDLTGGQRTKLSGDVVRDVAANIDAVAWRMRRCTHVEAVSHDGFGRFQAYGVRTRLGTPRVERRLPGALRRYLHRRFRLSGLNTCEQ
jgi:hypothetical protein